MAIQFGKKAPTPTAGPAPAAPGAGEAKLAMVDASKEEVIDPQRCLDQCGDWKFVVELLQDLLQDEEKNCAEMQEAINKDDHKAYSSAAHGVKGAALNLHLPALTLASKAAEMVGKDLMSHAGVAGVAAATAATPPVASLLPLRQPYLEQLKREYRRVRDYLPEAELKANDEGEGDLSGDDGQ